MFDIFCAHIRLEDEFNEKTISGHLQIKGTKKNPFTWLTENSVTINLAMVPFKPYSVVAGYFLLLKYDNFKFHL